MQPPGGHGAARQQVKALAVDVQALGRTARSVGYETRILDAVEAKTGRYLFSHDVGIQNLVKAKPASAKGTYLRSITISSTMSPGIAIDPKTIPGI